jgi:hypothetical protein
MNRLHIYLVMLVSLLLLPSCEISEDTLKGILCVVYILGIPFMYIATLIIRVVYKSMADIYLEEYRKDK